MTNTLSTGTTSRDDRDVGRDIVVRLRITETEDIAWRAAAKAAGMSLSEFIRRRVQGEMRIEAPPPPSAAPHKTKRKR